MGRGGSQAAGATGHHLPPPAQPQLRGQYETWGTQGPHRTLSPKPVQVAQAAGPVHPGEGTSSPTPDPHAWQQVSRPALPPTWAWPCPCPTGGASHPVRLCAGPHGPGPSAPVPASIEHSPSPPPGVPGPAVAGLDSGLPVHPSGRRQAEHSRGQAESGTTGDSTNPSSQALLCPIYK